MAGKPDGDQRTCSSFSLTIENPPQLAGKFNITCVASEDGDEYSLATSLGRKTELVAAILQKIAQSLPNGAGWQFTAKERLIVDDPKPD